GQSLVASSREITHALVCGAGAGCGRTQVERNAVEERLIVADMSCPQGIDSLAGRAAERCRNPRSRIAADILVVPVTRRGCDQQCRGICAANSHSAPRAAATAARRKHAHPSLKAQSSVELLAIGRGATPITVNALHDEIAVG